MEVTTGWSSFPSDILFLTRYSCGGSWNFLFPLSNSNILVSWYLPLHHIVMVSQEGQAYKLSSGNRQLRHSIYRPSNSSLHWADTFHRPDWASGHAKLQVSYQVDTAHRFSYLDVNSYAIIHIIAIVSSSLSVLAGLVAIYFFHRMEKRYRHK